MKFFMIFVLALLAMANAQDPVKVVENADSVLISNPDPGFSRPVIGQPGYVPISTGPAYVNRPYNRPQRPIVINDPDPFFAQPTVGNGYEPIDNRPYIVNPPKDYNPNGNGYEPIDNGAYYVDPPQGRPYFRPTPFPGARVGK
ncbi:uncharacterized protein LOC114253636 isoform X6 [Bombyx mandarina]|uniref:Uncharacterized protein LOC114253636 isoform X6 n=1 Tax=Bombyx mandarina TaxID=7092 RepID=A0A6J2J707_BOMMA|nr:uncharacterized protein LOC114253636 isoform X6 [Bombyx mandarina]